MSGKTLTMETLLEELRKASHEGPLTLKRLRMLTTYESRQAAVRNNPEYMDTVRRAYMYHKYVAPELAPDHIDTHYDMMLTVEAFALGFIAGLNTKAGSEETDQ